LLQNLGQKMRRDLFLLGDVLDHGVLAFRNLRQVHKRPDGVLC
jgi:hypothetical protein